MAVVLIQGGDEFDDACRSMDQAFLAAAGPGPIVVLPAASESEHAAAVTAAHATDYYLSLGADEVLVADSAQAATALAQARAVVLPGGSPGLLLERLRADNGLLADALRAVLLAGGGISGSSAGAMVLAAATWLPDRQQVVPGTALLPSEQPLLVLPHADGTPTRWLALAGQVPTGTRCLALAEHAGRLYAGGEYRDFGEVHFWE